MTLEHALLVVDSLAGIDAPGGVVEVQRPARDLQVRIEEVRERLLEWEKDFVEGRSEATVRAVRSDWQQFRGWCERKGARPLPASFEDFHRFMTEMLVLGRRKATLSRYAYTVGLVHKAARVPDPTADERWPDKWKVIVRKLAKAKRAAPRQAEPLKTGGVETILATLGDSGHDLRDAAMLSLAADTLCRESELAQVELEHLEPGEGGDWTLFVGHSKRDQEGVGAYRFVSAETKARIDRWCTHAQIESGAIFRPIGGRPKTGRDGEETIPEHIRPREVARIFRQRALAAGLKNAGRISGHSTRVGSAVDLVENGATISETAEAGGWKDHKQVGHYVKRSAAGRNAMATLRRKQRTSSPQGDA